MSSIVSFAHEIASKPVLAVGVSFVLVASAVGLTQAITVALEVLQAIASTRTTVMLSASVVTVGVLVVLWTIGAGFLFDSVVIALRP